MRIAVPPAPAIFSSSALKAPAVSFTPPAASIDFNSRKVTMICAARLPPRPRTMSHQRDLSVDVMERTPSRTSASTDPEPRASVAMATLSVVP